MSYPPEDPAAGFRLPGVPRLRFLDVADPRLPEPVRAQRLAQLEQVHRQFFPDYQHVFGEWEQGLAEGWPDPEAVVHLWLILDGNEPVGEVIQHTNLRRHVNLVHFVCLAAWVRTSLPHSWLQGLSDGFVLCGRTDAEAAGEPLWAVMGEVPPDHVHKWQRVGFRPLEVGYVEPVHGMHWPRDLGPELNPLTSVIRLTDQGAGLPLREVAGSGLRGYMFDYYQLPPEHPQVVAALERAGDLAD